MGILNWVVVSDIFMVHLRRIDATDSYISSELKPNSFKNARWPFVPYTPSGYFPGTGRRTLHTRRWGVLEPLTGRWAEREPTLGAEGETKTRATTGADEGAGVIRDIGRSTAFFDVCCSMCLVFYVFSCVHDYLCTSVCTQTWNFGNFGTKMR